MKHNQAHVRTTTQVEGMLRFVDEIVWRRDGFPQLEWDFRELTLTYQKSTRIAEDLDHVVQKWRFSGRLRGNEHYRILIRVSRQNIWSEKGRKHPFVAPPNRIWVEHRIDSCLTHWERLSVPKKGKSWW